MLSVTGGFRGGMGQAKPFPITGTSVLNCSKGWLT